MGVPGIIGRKLGMGGYYNIYNVAGELNRSDYTMTLKCKYNSNGLCGEASVDKSYNICSEEGLRRASATRVAVATATGQAMRDVAAGERAAAAAAAAAANTTSADHVDHVGG